MSTGRRTTPPQRPGRARAAFGWVRSNAPFAAIIAISFGGSYNHIVTLAEKNGQHGIEAKAIAATVDLLCYIFARERQRDKEIGRERRGLVSYPTMGLSIGVITTLAANLATAGAGPWGHIVAAIPAAVLLLVIGLMERRASFRPKIAEPAGDHGPGTAQDQRRDQKAPGSAVRRDHRQDRDQDHAAATQDQPGTSPARVVLPPPAVAPVILPPAAEPPAKAAPGPMRTMGTLQRQALSVIDEHKNETGECSHGARLGERMNNKELARALQVSNHLAGEVRKQIREREEGAA
jgi:Protein of unknown function (DUF2637)